MNIEYCAMEKFRQENSMYDMKCDAHTLGTFSLFVFTCRLLVLCRFLWWDGAFVAYIGTDVRAFAERVIKH
jgi:hypothetical protein